MAEVIQMPLLSDTMEEGVIAAWHKKEGDEVNNGDLLAEIETDKATMDFESPFKGVLLHIGAGEGDAVPVGQLLAIVGEKGEDISGVLEEAKAASAEGDTDSGDSESDSDSESSEEKAAETAAEATSTAKAEKDASSSSSSSSSTDDGRIKASPLARSMAKDKGIDLSTVTGTGEGGRIVKRDIENYEPPAAAPASSFTSSAPVGEESYSEVKLSQMRKTIAKRLAQSKFSSPHFYLTMEINMDRVIEARKKLNDVAPVKISFNDIIIKAVTAALRQHPAVNASWLDDRIRYNDHIHIGMAVAVDEGLVVPVIRFADMKGLAAISQESKDLAGRARERKLGLEEMQGNTFTISNLGMFGIEEFTAIINPPDACILAIGGIKQTPVVRDGEIVPGNVMKVTLSCDHRVVDGAVGSAFLVTFKQLLEEPLRILI